MNLLLINVPSRKGRGGVMLPMGLLYVGAILERSGHGVRIVDPYLDDAELTAFDRGSFDGIDQAIREFEPSVVGYGGIATSYGRTKRLSLYLKNGYPDIFQIAGGALSSVYELLLKETAVDAVFHGETEISLPMFLDAFQKGNDLHQIPGTSYLHDGQVMRMSQAEQVKDLDAVPFPAYHLVDLSQYLANIDDWLDSYALLLGKNPHCSAIIERIGNKKLHVPIISSRGCTHSCLFCYRHVRGFRQHSVQYVVEHMQYLRKEYGIEGFQFCDELFNADLKWVSRFCDALDSAGLDIFYLIGGARVDKITREILVRLRDTGCIEINYGHESGSDRILKEYRKGVTSTQSREITLLTTKEVGLNCPVQLVIGGPGETNETIRETIEFLKDVDAYQYSLNYLIALPETPIWRYVTERGLIEDVEKYLDLVAQYGGLPVVNLTGVPDKTWKSWRLMITMELDLHHYRKHRLTFQYLSRLLYHKILFHLFPLMPPKVLDTLRLLRKYLKRGRGR